MNYKKLGNTDLKVSTICLGTMTWGEQNTQAEGLEQMDFALDQGVNFWDTAEIYSIPPREETFGSTEKIIGNWFEKTKKRDKVILASKVCGPMREYVRGGGNQFGKKNITEALDGSLKRLKTDYIDLYQLHWPERSTNCFGRRDFVFREDEREWNKFEAILESLNKFIKSGKLKVQVPNRIYTLVHSIIRPNDDELRIRRDVGLVPEWKYIKAHYLGCKPFHMKQGVAASNYKHWMRRAVSDYAYPDKRSANATDFQVGMSYEELVKLKEARTKVDKMTQTIWYALRKMIVEDGLR